MIAKRLLRRAFRNALAGIVSMVIFLAAAAAVTVGAVALIGTASASVVGTPAWSQNLAGYAGVNNGLKAFNDVRWNVVAPDEPASVPADTIAVGGVLQAVSNIPSDTVGLGLVWDDTVHPGTCADGGAQSDQWTLEEGLTFTGAPGVPLPPANLKPIPDGAGIFCVPAGQKYYMEIHDSTFLNEIAFVAGDTEPGNALGFSGLSLFGPNVRFHQFGVGTDTTSGADASLLAGGTLAAFTRDGLTQLLAPQLKAGGTNSRLTLNAENLREYIGTQDGTPSGAVTLQPSPPGVGSAFTVTAIP